LVKEAVARPAARYAGCGERTGRFACPLYRDGAHTKKRGFGETARSNQGMCKEMNLTKQKKFEVAVYIAVGALAIPIAVISAIFLSGPIRDFFLGLAADFLGVALLFFLVN
jgi:hypothetical protein